MITGSPAPARRGMPPRYSTPVTCSISLAVLAIYALLLFTPAVDADTRRTRLRGAASALGSAIAAVEASYATGDLNLTDQHLGLPASPAFCAQLRAALPDSGRAVLRCELHADVALRGSVVWRRTAAGEWQCETLLDGDGSATACPVQ